MNLEPLDKTDSMPKFFIIVKDSFLTNSKVLVLNMRIGFSNSSQKNPNKAILVANSIFFI